MKVLGIDPGTATTGFGVVEQTSRTLTFIDAGVIQTSKESLMPDRLETIFAELTELVLQHRPDFMAVEQLFFARNVTTAMTVGQARGVILLVAAKQHVPVREFTPLQVKMAVTGYGQAKKDQVQQMVKNILKLKVIPRPDDAADALAVAIAGSAQLEVGRGA